ncbi:MAG: polyprenyl synthetase family protein [Pirellulales bacterium]|nr:polyprenyl synthetase family protein [Pirellulales bacterium]
MSSTTPDVAASRPRLDAVYAPIRDDLRAAEEVLRAELRNDYPFVDELVQHGFQLGGKRLRPALVLLAGKACGELTADHHTIAAVVEMIHTATLVHDDVLDDADMRRHRPTANARWDNQASVLLGDYLFTHSFYLASTLPSTRACQLIGRATNIVCEGELRQINRRGYLALDEEEYLSIIEGKTSELCACCCQLGAFLSGADEKVQVALDRYGRYLGNSFQITDDLLDLLGEEEQTGKSLGTDLAQQKMTLPLIYLRRTLDEARRREFDAVLSSQGEPGARRAALDSWFQASDAIEYARGRADDFAGMARAELEILSPSDARQVLEQLTYFVVARRQ